MEIFCSCNIKSPRRLTQRTIYKYFLRLPRDFRRGALRKWNIANQKDVKGFSKAIDLWRVWYSISLPQITFQTSLSPAHNSYRRKRSFHHSMLRLMIQDHLLHVARCEFWVRWSIQKRFFIWGEDDNYFIDNKMCNKMYSENISDNEEINWIKPLTDNSDRPEIVVRLINSSCDFTCVVRRKSRRQISFHIGWWKMTSH